MVPPPFVKAMLPAFKLPAPTLIVLVELEGRGMVIAPLTVKVMPVLIFKLELLVAVERKVIEAQAASAVTVTVTPLLMVTASPATGTDEPPQVAVLFQLPLTEAVFAAAMTGFVTTNDAASMAKSRKTGNTIFMDFVFHVAKGLNNVFFMFI